MRIKLTIFFLLSLTLFSLANIEKNRSEENLRKRVDQYYKALNRRDGKKFLKLLSKEWMPYDKYAQKAIISWVEKAWPYKDWKYKIKSIEIKGDEAEVLVEYSVITENPELKRSYLEEYGTLPPDFGIEFEGNRKQIWVFENGNWFFKKEEHPISDFGSESSSISCTSRLAPQNGKGLKDGEHYQSFNNSFFDFISSKEKFHAKFGDFEWKDYEVGISLPADYYDYELEPNRKFAEKKGLKIDEISFGIVARYNPEDGTGYYLWVTPLKRELKEWEREPIKTFEQLYQFLIRKREGIYPCRITLEKRVKERREILSERIFFSKERWINVKISVVGEAIEAKIAEESFIKAFDGEIKNGMIAIFYRPHIEYRPSFRESIIIKREIMEKETVRDNE